MKNILDISGFVYSGKSAVSDILREVEGFYVPPVEEEFDLLRLPGGLIDFKHAVLNWSPIRSIAAYREFANLANMVGRKLPYISRPFTNSLDYSGRYPGFQTYVDNFFDRITLTKWCSPWPFDNFRDGTIFTFLRKVGEKNGYMKLRNIYLVDKESFIKSAQQLLESILWSKKDARNLHTVVVHNALEPFDPASNLDLLGSKVSIAVDRDPRDIYASAHLISMGKMDRLNRYLNIPAAHNVDTFIQRQKIYQRHIVNNENVLRLKYEDLVHDYDHAKFRLFNFLNINELDHGKDKSKYFNPQKSIKNTQIWTRPEMRYLKYDIEKIERELLS